MAILRSIWLVSAAGLLAAAGWMVVAVRVIALAELARTTASSGGPSDSSAHPSGALCVTVSVVAMLAAAFGGWLERRTIHRSSALRRTPDRREATSPLPRCERANVAMVRAFSLRMGLVIAFSFGLAVWAIVRSYPPFGAPIVGDERVEGVGATVRSLSRAVEGIAITFIALALLGSVLPTRRRLVPPPS